MTAQPGFRAIEAVLFDMDGTLVDSDAAVERAWRAWAGEHRVDPDAALPALFVEEVRGCFRELRP
jgi:sugar-phosphatase